MSQPPCPPDSDVTFVSPELRDRLLSHPIYNFVTSLNSARLFMRDHVFAVWDFMSLAKRLQRDVTCVSIPWLGTADAQSARFLNEIVLAEESDEDGLGGFTSHFELYREAMQEIGADHDPIDEFIQRLRNGSTAADALTELPVRPETADFVRHTLHVATSSGPHEVAAAFCFGREDVIPDMFRRLLNSCRTADTSLARFQYYLDRHIEIDGDSHGPMARQLVLNLCGASAERLQEARAAADKAVELRIRLWDGLQCVLEAET